VLPIEEHGFALHKGAFRDALVCVMDGYQVVCLLGVCVCGQGFTVNHAIVLSVGSLPYDIMNLGTSL